MKRDHYKPSHLYHHSQKGSYQFITFRTFDSIDEIVSKIDTEYEDVRKKQAVMDEYLDTSLKGAYLTGEALGLMKEIIHSYDTKFYDIISYVVMPNHIHILLKQNCELKEIMQKLKGSSSMKLNKLLQRTGIFWQHDYYDRAVRDEKHFLSTLAYIKDNAVKADLKDCIDRYYLSEVEL